MNAIRRDEEMDNLHSIYVDQWDWERVISRETRNTAFLKEIVQKIVDAICDTQELLKVLSCPEDPLSAKVSFVTTQELEDMYPTFTPQGAGESLPQGASHRFVMQIGDLLKSGVRHDGRAPDYDDWASNGDILLWNETLGSAFEVSLHGHPGGQQVPG